MNLYEYIFNRTRKTKGGISMIEATDARYWDERFEQEPKHKISFANKIIMIGLILFGMCTTINTVLIYTFFNLLNKI